ncbi:MFS transporter permease [Formosa sp. Hel3_A1_48]|jgi:UMF1 family MFS transporter|uniref:MFS transporter n=1 Tax=Formosa sp. Hel3_A1_48 TaxID=1336795 RepID=UPI00084E26BB|nr:MFS transporter [Formosa sp. Hel3_A1_48]AOR25247.1 MFS transporter permease [Formosa sp. Hel3_A1_48]MDC0951005.1 MFS transporter [Flavobacteriaceae bacterium]
MKKLERGSKKLINAWAFYDWANSVYPLVISTAVFPIYYSSMASSFANIEGKIGFLGALWNPTTLYDYTLAFSFLIVAFISPILSGIADYTGDKLKFLKRFCLLGSISVISLFFFKGESTLWIALLCTVFASIGFWGSIVFYNAYLPEVAYPEQQDAVSAKGFIYGYVGSVLLLIFSLVLVQKPEWFGITDPTFAPRITFALVGVWWFGFAQITYKRLPKNELNQKSDKEYIWNGFLELKSVFKSLNSQSHLKYFLMAFFFLSVGVQTIILMAGIFGSEELGLPTFNLILTILIVQIVAIFGAYLFSKLSDRIGNISTLKITLCIWGLVCFIAFVLDKDQPNVDNYFYAMGIVLGFVLGATQSLTRSTYSKLLPETQDHATYFSFYDVTEKIAIVLGMIVFGLLIAITGSMQYSVLALAGFFFMAFLCLFKLKRTKYVR